MSKRHEPAPPELHEPTEATAHDEPGDPLYPPTGQSVVIWSVDVRRWDDDREYRNAVTDFVYSRVPGATLRSVNVLQDETGALVLGAWTALHADGSFRGRRPDGGLVRAPVILPLPPDVTLPR